MGDIFPALFRSLYSCGLRRVRLTLVASFGAAFLLWAGLLLWMYAPWVLWLVNQPPFSWLTDRDMVFLALLFSNLVVWSLVGVLAWLIALAAAAFLLPALARAIVRREYPELAWMGSRPPLLLSVVRGALAMLAFLAGIAASLPFWPIPGAGLFVLLVLTAWLARTLFADAALSAFATPDELRALRQRYARSRLLLGVLFALLAFVPVMGLAAPAFVALAYVHLGLRALSELRGDALVVERGRIV